MDWDGGYGAGCAHSRLLRSCGPVDTSELRSRKRRPVPLATCPPARMAIRRHFGSRLRFVMSRKEEQHQDMALGPIGRAVAVVLRYAVILAATAVVAWALWQSQNQARLFPDQTPFDLSPPSSFMLCYPPLSTSTWSTQHGWPVIWFVRQTTRDKATGAVTDAHSALPRVGVEPHCLGDDPGGYGAHHLVCNAEETPIQPADTLSGAGRGRHPLVLVAGRI